MYKVKLPDSGIKPKPTASSRYYIGTDGDLCVCEPAAPYGKEGEASTAPLNDKNGQLYKAQVDTMRESVSRYIDLKSDFGFKYLLGRPSCAARFQSLLAEIFKDHFKVGKLQYRNSEQLGRTIEGRKGIVDVLCEEASGCVFITEMQRNFKPNFYNRMVFYQSIVITNDAMRGDWDFCSHPVCTLSFVDPVNVEWTGIKT